MRLRAKVWLKVDNEVGQRQLVPTFLPDDEVIPAC